MNILIQNITSNLTWSGVALTNNKSGGARRLTDAGKAFAAHHYVTRLVPVREIAKALGVSTATVLDAARKLGAPGRRVNLNHLQMNSNDKYSSHNVTVTSTDFDAKEFEAKLVAKDDKIGELTESVKLLISDNEALIQQLDAKDSPPLWKKLAHVLGV